MNTFRNRFVIALVGLLLVGATIVALGLSMTDQLRSAVRVEASDQAQIEAYLELRSSLRELYAESGRILRDASAAADLDFATYRGRIDELLLTLRAEIEREDIEGEDIALEGIERPGSLDDQAAKRARLLSLTNEIQSTLAGVEIAAALFRADRAGDGVKVLRQALDERVDNKLDAIIDQAVAQDKAQAEEVRAAVLRRLDVAADRAIGFFAIYAAALGVFVAAIVVPFVRSMAFLRGQTDKLALGGDVDPISDPHCREFAAVHEGLNRAAETHARLRNERDACEEEFTRRTDAMREDEQVRRDFLADVSHELRTPLTVLRGVAEVALRTQSNDPEELKTSMARIADESRHVTRIVDDLFFIARSRTGALDLRTDIVDLAAVSAAAAEEAESLARQAGGRVLWSHLPKPVEVEGDAGRLRQLFTILVDNAFKYGGRNPVVEVDHTLAGETVTVSIRDHGPGVPQEDLPRVFERLYRSAESTEADGSGLGLPMAKSIVEGHGGEISLGNAEGGGALAEVTLPIFDADALEETLS